MAQTRLIERGGRRWHVRAAEAHVLAEEAGPLERPETLNVVKRGRGRTVRRFEIAGRAYFLKDYASGGPVRALRARLGHGPARREWANLRTAREAGVDVPEPVAWAEGPREALVTAAVPDAARLDEYLFEQYFEPVPGGPPDPPYPGARPPELVKVFRRRREPPPGAIDPKALAILLAETVAHLWDAGLYLPDLHPGNLLLASEEGGRFRLVVVDLAEARSDPPPAALVQHLAVLEHFFEPLATPAERVRCLERTAQLIGVPLDARVIAAETASHRRSFYGRRDRRTHRTSKYFTPMVVGPWSGRAATDWAEPVRAMLEAGDPTEGLSAEVLKNGRSAGVWRVTLEDGRSLVVKRRRRIRARPLAGLGTSRSEEAFHAGHALLVRSIATARPAAAVDRRRGARLEDTLLLTELIDGPALPVWLASDPAAGARHALARRMAAMVARLHEAGFSHRDLKAPNILVVPGDDPRPYLVDLDGLRRADPVPERRRVKDLMRLAVSLEEWGVARATDRLRFLRAYLWPGGRPQPVTVRGRGRGSDAPGRTLARWWRAIEHECRAKRQALVRKARGAAAP